MNSTAPHATLLEVQGLKVAHLQPVSFCLPARTLAILRGASGSGKSLLCRAIIDLIPSTGRVSCDRQLREALPAHRWRQQVQYLPAESQWWCDRVLDHFKQPLSGELLASLGLDQSLLAQDPLTLSSGQKQKLALLRSLENKPRVLLLDELGANLDALSRQQVLALVSHYLDRHQACALWICHDDAWLESATSRFVLENGILTQLPTPPADQPA